ncbi:DUF917 domain-containing protein [Conexibacter woesei]|uniref:DUF917 domain-containing protein n=1 Tax=Conexibacter woesei TaxID=191495 RepID=UPI0003228147|nr:DUF917 domain-containing protein [Conexibacter woesei]
MRIGVEEVDPLVLGCTLLSAGGGGVSEMSLAELFLRGVLGDAGTVDVVPAEALDDDALVIPVALVGSPTAFSEQLISDALPLQLKMAVEEHAQREVAAVMPLQIAGVNGPAAVAFAARLGLPLVDADGMARSSPTLRQVWMHLAGIDVSPVVLVGEEGTSNVLRARTIETMNRLAWGAFASLAGTVACAMFLLDGRDVARATIPGSVSAAIELGRRVRGANGSDPVAAVAAALGGQVVVRGKIVHVQRRADPPWGGGSIVVETDRDERIARVEFQTENVAVVEDGRVIATVPDVIDVLDVRSGMPVLPERYRYGRRVAIVAAPTHPLWYGERALATTGPAAYGLDLPARSIRSG